MISNMSLQGQAQAQPWFLNSILIIVYNFYAFQA